MFVVVFATAAAFYLHFAVLHGRDGTRARRTRASLRAARYRRVICRRAHAHRVCLFACAAALLRVAARSSARVAFCAAAACAARAYLCA